MNFKEYLAEKKTDVKTIAVSMDRDDFGGETMNAMWVCKYKYF